MFKHILLATDGSPHAERAAEAAIGLMLELPKAEITIVHVSSDAPSRSDLVHANFNVKRLLESEAHREITKTENAFKDAKIPFTLKVALGDAADQIVEISKREKHDLIIMGSRGLGMVSEVIMGSVSRKVLHQAKCPVMIVK